MAQIRAELVFSVCTLALLKAPSLQRREDSNGYVVLKTPPRHSTTKSTPYKTIPISGLIDCQQELLGL